MWMEGPLEGGNIGEMIRLINRFWRESEREKERGRERLREQPL